MGSSGDLMLPNSLISSQGVKGVFMTPDDRQTDPFVDYEYGGVALNDPTQGLLVQPWTCFVNGISVMCGPVNGQAVELFTKPGLEEIAFAFDQNMRPTVAYIAEGVLYLRWYDSSVPDYVTTSFGPGHRNSRLTLDDRRPETSSFSDVVFAYIKNGAIYYRLQRDRYGVEYFVRGDVEPHYKLRNIGITDKWRLQFELV
jgi:hypothetical protein